jgi:hypothetical protein
MRLTRTSSAPLAAVLAAAAIGAAGAAGLLAISLAGAMTLRRRQRDPRSPTAIS